MWFGVCNILMMYYWIYGLKCCNVSVVDWLADSMVVLLFFVVMCEPQLLKLSLNIEKSSIWFFLQLPQ